MDLLEYLIDSNIVWSAAVAAIMPKLATDFLLSNPFCMFRLQYFTYN